MFGSTFKSRGTTLVIFGRCPKSLPPVRWKRYKPSLLVSFVTIGSVLRVLEGRQGEMPEWTSSRRKGEWASANDLPRYFGRSLTLQQRERVRLGGDGGDRGGSLTPVGQFLYSAQLVSICKISNEWNETCSKFAHSELHTGLKVRSYQLNLSRIGTCGKISEHLQSPEEKRKRAFQAVGNLEKYEYLSICVP